MPIIKDVIFCDYVSQDVTGKHNCLGIYFGDIIFSEPPDFLPAIILSIHIGSTSQAYSLAITFDDPDGRNIVRTDVFVDYPHGHMQNGDVIINFQVPPISNPAPGTYFVRFFDSSNSKLAEFGKNLRVGPVPASPPRLNILTAVGEDFKSEFGL